MSLNDVTDANGNFVFRDAIKFAAADTKYDFSDAMTPKTTTPHDSTNVEGDVSPLGGSGDSVLNDFEEQFLMVNRLSNLVTTRSDSYTVYIVVQGWQNVGTTTPRLVTQRRAAFIIDRSNVTGVSGTANPKITNVPTD